MKNFLDIFRSSKSFRMTFIVSFVVCLAIGQLLLYIFSSVNSLALILEKDNVQATLKIIKADTELEAILGGIDLLPSKKEVEHVEAIKEHWNIFKERFDEFLILEGEDVDSKLEDRYLKKTVRLIGVAGAFIERLDTSQSFMKTRVLVEIKKTIKELIDHIGGIINNHGREAIERREKIQNDISIAQIFVTLILFFVFLSLNYFLYHRVKNSEKLVEANFKQSQLLEKLKNSELVLKSTLETVPVSVISIGSDGIIRNINRTTTTMLGWNSKDLIGKNVSMLMPIPYRDEHDGYLKRYLKTFVKHVIGTGREVELLTKDKRSVEAFLSVGEYKINGEYFFTGVLNDISAIKERERELKYHKENLEEMVDNQTKDLASAKEKAEAANVAKTTFLANISHEIRTPMHGVLSFAGIGIEQAELAERSELKDYFSEIQETGYRLMDLLNDLLDLSKLEAGKFVYDMKPNDLCPTIQSVLSKYSKLAQEKQVDFKFVNKIGSCEAYFDENKIHQVLGNILSNAIKFAFNGSSIFVETSANENELIVEVENEGIEIPETEINNIFDKFFQSTKTRSNAGGTGLGLSICKNIIDDHQGRIWARCHEQKVKVSFSLPKNKSSREAG